MIRTLSSLPFPKQMGTMNGASSRNLRLASPGGVAERSESFKIMIASGNHSKIEKLDFLASGTSEPIGKKA